MAKTEILTYDYVIDYLTDSRPFGNVPECSAKPNCLFFHIAALAAHRGKTCQNIG